MWTFDGLRTVWNVEGVLVEDIRVGLEDPGWIGGDKEFESGFGFGVT